MFHSLLRNAVLPKTSFSGYLKQLSTEDMRPEVAELFDTLFPKFRSWTQLTQHSASRTRRFATPDLPRGKYYSLTVDKDAAVDQTLAHELRAYRNARELGYIDVIDLSCDEITICIKTRKGKDYERFSREKSIGVLVHDLNPSALGRIDP